MRLITLGLGVCLAASQAAGAATAQTTGPAPDCCGAAPVHDYSLKSMVGTAVNSTSSFVYFTGYKGNVSEIYYPTVDTLATANMEFLVGDTARTFLDEEKNQSWTVTQPDRRSMRWLAVTGNAGHDWRIAKTIFADPSNNTLIQETTFEALNGKTVGDFNLYLLYKPYLKNVAANNSAMTVGSGGNAYLVASSGDGSEFSALGASLGWTVQNGAVMASNGYFAVNDGWQDLFVSNPNPFSMRWAYSSAGPGNVTQMGRLSTGGNSATATAITFVVAVGFGPTQADAVAALTSTLGEDISVQQGVYDNAWHDYDAGLSDQSGKADDQYYLSAMTLKTMQDKSNGAMIAGIGTPWGFASGDGNYGYHLVWSRDMYKFANALITAGDSASAGSAVNWLFNHDIAAGRFPQNAFVNGTPFRNAVQMDEQAMPIILAYRLGPAVYNPLWPQIQRIANFITSAGPWTEQERWEETSGYSPSTIAAEIAGLVDAAQIALANNDPADAANWLNAADYWQQNIAAWTYTSQGCPNANSNCNSTPMYMRINTSGAQGGSPPGSWNPAANPNPDMTVTINNGGGAHRAIDIIDGGFLELVRMGVKRPNDPTIISSLAAYDSVIEEAVGANAYPAWFRYNFDGYGETNAGGPFQDGAAGRGRLWPIFDAERGNYAIAATGNGAAGAPYLAALKAFSTPQGFISEQIWNPSATLPPDVDTPTGWAVTVPPGDSPGEATGSMAPLNWAQGEYINLLADIAASKVLDMPQAVCSRYYACPLAPAPGKVEVDINVNATTQWGQYMYVTGDTGALGGWNPNLGLPVDSASYPVWKNAINLAAGSTIQYKYYRKNADGSVTWECYPDSNNCSGNRSLAVPSSGPVPVNDTVRWN
jgi:glucoamylase